MDAVINKPEPAKKALWKNANFGTLMTCSLSFSFPSRLHFIRNNRRVVVCPPVSQDGPFLTWREALDDGLVVHLQRGVATAPRESHHVVLAVAHRHRALLDDDVVRSHVEDHADLSPFLQQQRRILRKPKQSPPDFWVFSMLDMLAWLPFLAPLQTEIGKWGLNSTFNLNTAVTSFLREEKWHAKAAKLEHLAEGEERSAQWRTFTPHQPCEHPPIC